MDIRTSRKKWEEYLTDVREYLPEEFECDCIDIELVEKSGAYIFTAFMNDVSEKECADNLISKLGVEE